jgi:hypothetical protein
MRSCNHTNTPKYKLSFLLWPLLPIHCRCRALLLHLITLRNTQTHTHTHKHTLSKTPLDWRSPIAETTTLQHTPDIPCFLRDSNLDPRKLAATHPHLRPRSNRHRHIWIYSVSELQKLQMLKVKANAAIVGFKDQNWYQQSWKSNKWYKKCTR